MIGFQEYLNFSDLKMHHPYPRFFQKWQVKIKVKYPMAPQENLELGSRKLLWQ